MRRLKIHHEFVFAAMQGKLPKLLRHRVRIKNRTVDKYCLAFRSLLLQSGENISRGHRPRAVFYNGGEFFPITTDYAST